MNFRSCCKKIYFWPVPKIIHYNITHCSIQWKPPVSSQFFFYCLLIIYSFFSYDTHWKFILIGFNQIYDYLKPMAGIIFKYCKFVDLIDNRYNWQELIDNLLLCPCSFCYTSTIMLVGQKLLTMGKNIKIKSYRLSLTKVVLMKVAILLGSL